MAKTNVDKIFDKVEKDFVDLSKKAAREAANKAQKDIKEKADKFIDEYYKYDAKWYKKQRKHALYKLVEEYYEEKETSDGITIKFGIVYNPNKIEGIHKSNSWYHQSGTRWISRADGDFDFDSQNNGVPSATWITEKFWEGIHPSGKVGDDDGVHDPMSPDEKMQHFFNTELDNLLRRYISKALLSAVKEYF